MYKQRDIILIPFPYSDLTGAKLRPALIISNSKLKENDKICCLITSQQTKEGISITNSAFLVGKLPFKSWIKPHRLFTINEKIVKKKLCTITLNFHEKVIGSVEDLLKTEQLS